MMMTANYTDTGIDAEIHDTATLTSLIWLRERLQSHIDALTPTLAETQQTGPVQVVDSDSPMSHKPHCDSDSDESEPQIAPEWSEWFDWSGGENPVPGCKVNTIHVSTVEDVDWANCSWWDHKPLEDAFSKGNITRYRVLLSSIPDGYSLMHGQLVADMPEGGE